MAADSVEDGNSNAVMDLVELYIGKDASNYYLAFTVTGDIGGTNWGKHALYIWCCVTKGVCGAEWQ